MHSVTPVLQTRKLRFRERKYAPRAPHSSTNRARPETVSTLATALGLSFFLCTMAAVWTFDWRMEGKGLAGVTCARCMINVCRVEVGCSSCLLVVSFLAGQLSSLT